MIFHLSVLFYFINIKEILFRAKICCFPIAIFFHSIHYIKIEVSFVACLLSKRKILIDQNRNYDENLSNIQEGRAALIEAGACGPLVEALKRAETVTKGYTARAIENLPEIQEAMARAERDVPSTP